MVNFTSVKIIIIIIIIIIIFFFFLDFGGGTWPQAPPLDPPLLLKPGKFIQNFVL